VKRVLVIEPDRSLRNQVQAKLEHHGFEVVHSECYDDALLVVSFSRVQLIVFGRNIPEIEKAQMACELNEDGITAPIISLRDAGGAERLYPYISAVLPETVQHQELAARATELVDVNQAA
jgi:DNA-binding response OmpR family regulator